MHGDHVSPVLGGANVAANGDDAWLLWTDLRQPETTANVSGDPTFRCTLGSSILNNVQ